MPTRTATKVIVSLPDDAASPAAIPHSREAEESVLGSLLINPEVYYELAGFLHSEDFYIHRHKWIFAAIASMFLRRLPVDLLTLTEELDRTSKLSEIGGPAYLTALVAQVPTSINAEAYGRIVESHAVRRRLVNAANQIAGLAYDEKSVIEDVTEKSVAALEGAIVQASGNSLVHIGDLQAEAFSTLERLNSSEELPGTPTGQKDLDQLLGNLQGSRLYVLAARPGQGKTSELLTISRNAAGAGKRVAIFSLEMTNQQINNRLISRETGIDSQKLDTGKFPKDFWPRITAGMERIGKLPIHMDDTPAITPLQLKSKCMRWIMANGPLDLIIVDYLQLMTSGQRMENRTQEVGYISRALKALSKELNVPVLAAAQLSRAVEQRADKRPQLSDLRESGDIEQDADVVMFLHRSDSDPEDDVTYPDLIVEKHRGGPVGTVPLRFYKKTTSFENGAVKKG
jgi:replicative DNA helicase